MATPLHTRAKRGRRKREGEEEEEGEVPKPCDAAGVAGAGDDATTLHYTALLPKLHGHDPPLHRHPFTIGTYGERPTLPCLPPDFATLAMALHTVSA